LRTGTGVLEHGIRGVVGALLVGAAMASGALASTGPPSVASPASRATPIPAASTTSTAGLTPSPSPIIPPHDAPAVKRTTAPLSPAPVASAPPPPDSIWLGNSETVTVPIVLHGERPFIQVVINGHPATAVVDTAAIETLIDMSAVDDGAATAAISLQIGDLRFPRLHAVRSRVRAYTETYLGAGADAIIGRDLIQRYPISLDFPNRALTVFRESRGAITAQPAGAVSMTLRVIDGRPAIAGSLDGQPPLWLALDTGVGYEMLLDSSQRGRSAHGEHSIPIRDSTMPGGEYKGMLVRARSLTIGSLTFNQPLVAFSASKAGQPASDLSGAVGATMLSGLNVSIDELAGTATMVASQAATAAHLYDPSGITLEMRDGAIVVHTVVPGTPADVAHVREGDEIVSINGLAPATLDFARQLLDGSPGSKVAIVYRRWRLIHRVTLTLHVII
jgi:PDZ domain